MQYQYPSYAYIQEGRYVKSTTPAVEVIQSEQYWNKNLTENR